MTPTARAVVALFLVSFLVCGCTHMVAGSESLPASERAILETIGADVLLIDGERPKCCLRTRFELAPGKHHLALSVGAAWLPWPNHPILVTFEARTSRTYVLDVVRGWPMVPHTALVNVVDKEEYDARSEFRGTGPWGAR
jgi:hypothetical protein